MIKFYTTDCPKCKILKNKFDESTLSYEEIDSIHEVYRRAGELGISSVPFCEMTDGSIKDFSEMMEYIVNGE